MPRLIDEQYFDYYKQRGVPASVLFASTPDDIGSRITRIASEDEDAQTISQAVQQDYLVKMDKDPKPYLAVLGGLRDDTLAAQCGLLLCAQFLKSHPDKKFYWHTLTGAFKDKIRDDDVLAEEVNSSGLLIISNVAKNSTNVKLEKLRDLCELYSHLPRVVILGGMNPLDFCTQILYSKPRYVVYFGR